MALKDIAKELGISISTVSRVLNNPNTNSASRKLRDKIWQTAKEQKYLPNMTARKLKKKELTDTSQIKLIYCLIGCDPQESKDDPFFSRLMNSIEEEAFKHNYILQYTFSISDIETPVIANKLRDNPSDSLIILGRFKPELFYKLKQSFKWIIYIGLNELDVSCDQILCSGYHAAGKIVNYLCDLGHINIGFIGSSEARYRGFCDAMASQSLPVDEHMVINDIILSMEGGYQGMLRLLSQFPDVSAICCANDLVSIGALRACKDQMKRVPEDISLMGIDDIENIEYTSPMLSSIHVPLDEMGRIAVKILIDRIEGGHNLNLNLSFPSHIVQRESCRKYC